MKRFLEIVSQAISVLCYPLWIPTIGITLYWISMQQLIPTLTPYYGIWLIVGTFVLTAIFPLLIILYLYYRGELTDLYINQRQERTIPYIYTIVFFAAWCYFLAIFMHAPLPLWVIAIGATCTLGIVMVVNKWWKISAHLSAMGGLVGGVCSVAMYYGIAPNILLCILLAISLILMYVRIFLKAHTPMQVVCGFLLGLIATFIPNLLLIYA